MYVMQIYVKRIENKKKKRRDKARYYNVISLCERFRFILRSCLHS